MREHSERHFVVVDLHPDTRQLLERLVKVLEGSSPQVDASPGSTQPEPDAGEPEHSDMAVRFFPPFGRRRGAQIQGAAEEDLRFYAQASIRSLEDPGKKRFHDEERARLEAYNAELCRQGVGPVE